MSLKSDPFEMIDASRKSSMARFINHSCEPNCETVKWMSLGEVVVRGPPPPHPPPPAPRPPLPLSPFSPLCLPARPPARAVTQRQLRCAVRLSRSREGRHTCVAVT